MNAIEMGKKNSKLVTKEEAAEISGLSESTITRLVDRDVFTVVTNGARRRGATIRIPRDEIEAYSRGGEKEVAKLRKLKGTHSNGKKG